MMLPASRHEAHAPHFPSYVPTRRSRRSCSRAASHSVTAALTLASYRFASDATLRCVAFVDCPPETGGVCRPPESTAAISERLADRNKRTTSYSFVLLVSNLTLEFFRSLFSFSGMFVRSVRSLFEITTMERAERGGTETRMYQRRSAPSQTDLEPTRRDRDASSANWKRPLICRAFGMSTVSGRRSAERPAFL
jgi:hypothetical protein